MNTITCDLTTTVVPASLEPGQVLVVPGDNPLEIDELRRNAAGVIQVYGWTPHTDRKRRRRVELPAEAKVAHIVTPYDDACRFLARVAAGDSGLTGTAMPALTLFSDGITTLCISCADPATTQADEPEAISTATHPSNEPRMNVTPNAVALKLDEDDAEQPVGVAV